MRFGAAFIGSPFFRFLHITLILDMLQNILFYERRKYNELCRRSFQEDVP